MPINNDVPIGSITAFAGDVHPHQLLALHDDGWLICDGTKYDNGHDYAELAAVIGTAYGGDNSGFRVPDFRGRFLRGVDEGTGKDPDAEDRHALATGGNTGSRVGSEQGDATGRPKVRFSTESEGDHSHDTPHGPTHDHHCFNPAGSPGEPIMEWSNALRTSSSEGHHSHTIISGGDIESRPSNIYLHWLIKFKNTNVS